MKLFAPLLLSLFFTGGIASAQTTQSTSQTSTGTSNRLSVTISNTNGVSSSATMTPNFDVTTSAELKIDPSSGSYQNITDPVASLTNSNSGSPGSGSSVSAAASGAATGASSITDLKYADGTGYKVTITPKDYTDSNGNALPRDSYSTANGSASGTVQTQLVIDATSSSFVNTFLSSF